MKFIFFHFSGETTAAAKQDGQSWSSLQTHSLRHPIMQEQSQNLFSFV